VRSSRPPRLFHRVLRARLNRCFDREFALTYAQYEILQILEEDPNLHASELARRLGMTRQAANRLIERLRRADLIDLAPREALSWTPWGRAGMSCSRPRAPGGGTEDDRIPNPSYSSGE
jgi:DNA-binding transcriptional ArsR family regulator